MADLATLIAEFLADGEASTREQRSALAHVLASPLREREAAALRPDEVRAVLADLEADGLSPARTAAVLDALRRVFAYAVARGRLRTSPLVGLAAPSRTAPSPTTAMLSLGRRAVTWSVRAAFLAFALIAVALAVALA